MILRPEIQFSSAFPDDSVEGETDLVQWPGRNIAEVIKAGLEARGYRVSEPIHAHEHGWELDIWRGRKRLWLQVSVLDAEVNYLMAENMTFFLWRDANLFRTFLSDLQSVLEADDRFSRVGWFAKGGIDRDEAPAAGPFDV
ncbi:MAG: hypothetical protein JHD15_02495 [Phenylobacterium sp.]|uniref:hypothetical protein n=1 Tax=Phenylobacterium sp. TaxID=1871053 RepID=UPI001A361F99|nr:hypothetical protein [Phenylobacterium sp.]MBJ7409221.1 hypothetical protein [Phenylobacterium sp.]